ncbi:MAG TPA: acetyl/propionyl/methylcrotonyl-CoA carboxylase subunit alpha [Burkholderiales bacterium]
MFRKLLIANRGEIACRVAVTARRMGMAVVAVYSEADAGAKHVALADEAFCIGPAAARESYLRAEVILDVAKRCGADAVHPGYGFLSENQTFARGCAAANIVFVGPPPEAIAAMGDKSAAKALMEKSGVPLVPGYHGENQDPAFLAGEAKKIGFPVLIKASAGGGGKGMRIVRDAKEFGAALAGAKREASAAFGDERVLIERYLERPRHIEVQVFGDTQGSFVYLFERDCSVQRRHQKVLEEAPAPGMTDARRKSMGETAVAAARSVAYVGAGTVEFIAEQDGRFYFMEMNTRLQVEHPVTEMITGLDLVEWQLRVAAGEPLPLAQADLSIRGHAIEARVYAENPDKGFLPSTGTLRHLATPEAAAFTTLGGALRVDSGVRAGDAISPWYDPMIAKLIAWGETREAACARLAAALDGFEVAGVSTNIEFLARVVRSNAFANADLDTGLIERERPALFPKRPPAPDEALAAAAWAELRLEEAETHRKAGTSSDPHSPWNAVDGWRLNEDSHHDFIFVDGNIEYPVTVRFTPQGERLVIADREYALGGEALPDNGWRLRLDTRSFHARAVRDGETWHVFTGGAARRFILRDPLQGLDADAGGGSLAAPMPGKVIAVMAKAGARVSKGAPLLVLEAMKMEHTLSAPADGTVKEVRCATGEQVLEGVELIVFEAG